MQKYYTDQDKRLLLCDAEARRNIDFIHQLDFEKTEDKYFIVDKFSRLKQLVRDDNLLATKGEWH